ncbi:hypothetical protein C8J56DRAFT_582145 [Mycena floridula]|nr:hypothetical protein C8J56DRAFT_582145 [Mycena floridula]
MLVLFTRDRPDQSISASYPCPFSVVVAVETAWRCVESASLSSFIPSYTTLPLLNKDYTTPLWIYDRNKPARFQFVILCSDLRSRALVSIQCPSLDGLSTAALCFHPDSTTTSSNIHQTLSTEAQAVQPSIFHQVSKLSPNSSNEYIPFKIPSNEGQLFSMFTGGGIGSKSHHFRVRRTSRHPTNCSSVDSLSLNATVPLQPIKLAQCCHVGVRL